MCDKDLKIKYATSSFSFTTFYCLLTADNELNIYEAWYNFDYFSLSIKDVFFDQKYEFSS